MTAKNAENVRKVRKEKPDCTTTEKGCLAIIRRRRFAETIFEPVEYFV